MSRSLACFLLACFFCFLIFYYYYFFFMTWISPVYRSEYHPNFRVIQIPRSILAHLCSIFIAPVRLIIVTLSFAHQRDFLWPESRPIIAQNFAQMSERKKCLARFSLIYRSIFIAPVRLIIVTLSIAHQRDFLWPESRPRLAQNFRTGRAANSVWTSSTAGFWPVWWSNDINGLGLFYAFPGSTPTERLLPRPLKRTPPLHARRLRELEISSYPPDYR